MRQVLTDLADQESTLIQFRRAGWSGLPRQLTASKIDSFVRLRVVLQKRCALRSGF